MSDFTPGPLSVSFGIKWPFEILIINESGAVIYRQSLPCHSSKDNNFEEALNCWNFKASERKEYAAINHRAVADAYLKAAAPAADRTHTTRTQRPTTISATTTQCARLWMRCSTKWFAGA